jgi:hypothetical protein
VGLDAFKGTDIPRIVIVRALEELCPSSGSLEKGLHSAGSGTLAAVIQLNMKYWVYDSDLLYVGRCE